MTILPVTLPIAHHIPNTPAVASEVIDGEAVIMNLQLGQYYSTAASGGFIWRCLELHQASAHIVDLLSQRYGIGRAAAAVALGRFIDQLSAAELIRPGDQPQASVALADMEGYAGLAEFTDPELHTFSDMQDLLLLDPIHDVDSAGWPSAQAWPQGDDSPRMN
jgi:hypothetical protein